MNATKRLIAILIMTMIAATAVFADDTLAPHELMLDLPAAQRVTRMFRAEGNVPIGEMTTADLLRLAGAVSVVRQQAGYIAHTGLKSAMMPGMGQFENGETGKGVVFLLTDVIVSAGTLVGSYLLLPESVRFSTLDYLRESVGTIEAAWKDLSFMDLLPSMSVAVGGSIVGGVVRMYAARDAATTARRRVIDGEVTFEPNPLSILDLSRARSTPRAYWSHAGSPHR